jgi:hypothetical protein
MAAQVLASPVVQLAHEVLAGGPHATAKAIELAEQLLEGARAPIGAVPAAGETMNVVELFAGAGMMSEGP